MARHGRVARYIAGPMRRVGGWFTRLDAEITAAVAAQQNAGGVYGSVGEIGVHHGRAFVALALALKGTERAFAIDIFGDQHLNADQSGRGDEEIFRGNLARNGVEMDRVAVLQGSSVGLGWEDIEEAVGARVRLFSIDGGHTAEVVENDFEIAHASLCDAGVVIADDYFNQGYPGVSEGVARFMVRHPEALRPFAIGDSRLFLCRPGWVEHYRAAVESSPAAAHRSLTASMWGSTVTIYRTSTRLIDRLRGLKLTGAVLRCQWGQALKPTVSRLLTLHA